MRHLLFGFAVLAGCGTAIQATQINPEPRPLPPRSPESVEVFASGPPARPHVDVSYLEAQNQSMYSTDGTPQFIAGLRAEAAELGCDGIVLGGVTNQAVSGDGLLTDRHTVGNIKGIVATCIAYTDVNWSAEQIHQACLAKRYSIYERMKQTENHDERVRLLQQAPHCDAPGQLAQSPAKR